MSRREAILGLACLALGVFVGLVADVVVPDSSPDERPRTPAPDFSLVRSSMDRLERRLTALEGALKALPGQRSRSAREEPDEVKARMPEKTEPPAAERRLEFRRLVDTTSGPGTQELADDYFLMSPAQARVRFGRPDRVNAAAGYENWIYTLRDYQDREYSVTLVFVSGHLIRVRTPEK